ncbi:MAG: SAM-dependent chlorinase/fluorinase [Candidatus Thiodiazotropha sp.]
MRLNKTDIALIASFTDFGPTGPYQGQMEAVLASQAPHTPQVTLLTDAPMFDAPAAGLLLSSLSDYMPSKTLFVAVVDPGVGGDRRPLLVRTGRHLFVGPDNGLFVPIVRRYDDCEIESIEWRPDRLSDSFHGRDLFAPVAAKLVNGEEVKGKRLNRDEIVGFQTQLDRNRIIYLDHFGNALTGILAEYVNDNTVIAVDGKSLRYARTFSDVAVGESFWYRNSIGLVEIAVNCGSAVSSLDLKLGMPIELYW